MDFSRSSSPVLFETIFGGVQLTGPLLLSVWSKRRDVDINACIPLLPWFPTVSGAGTDELNLRSS